MCTSQLKTPSVGAINGLSTALGTVLYGWTGTTSVVYRVDSEALLAAAKDADLISAANKMYYNDYRKKYADAIGDTRRLNLFIQTYRDSYDPDNLVSEANKQLLALEEKSAAEKEQARLHAYRQSFQAASDAAQLRTFILTYGKYDPDNLLPQAKDKLPRAEKEEAKVVAEAEARLRKFAVEEDRKLAGWRDNLKIGDETNCGPVVDKKPPLVRVYFPIANFGNEHWLRANQVEYPGRGCCFLNGHYVGSSC